MASSVSFPSTPAEEDDQVPTPVHRRAPHLPFRRISLPAVPSAVAHLRASQLLIPASTSTSSGQAANRISVASIDSLPEHHEHEIEPGRSVIAASTPSNVPRPRRSSRRPSSLAVPARTSQGSLLSQLDHKRTKVIREILDSERSYLDGLDLVYDLFLEPLIKSLDEPKPLLTRSQLNIVFPNFIEIWNFHRAFYSALHQLLAPFMRSNSPLPSAPASTQSFQITPSSSKRASSTPPFAEAPPPIGSLLLKHFHFLSLYQFFVTSYPTIMATLDNYMTPTSTNYSPLFHDFIRATQQDPRCNRLSLRDWLLTLIQRSPRYELLLRELIACTDPADPEYATLEQVLALVTKVNTTLNAALLNQTITLSLVAIQRATPNLPFNLVEPGRTFIRRGALLQIGDRLERVREFILFSDSLIWLSQGGEWEGAAGGRDDFFQSAGNILSTTPTGVSVFGPRRRRMSDVSGESSGLRRSGSTNPALNRLNGVEEDRWWYRGKVDLMDVHVVVPPVPFGDSSEEGRFEILNPEMSFALYATSIKERDTWTTAIREAKKTRLEMLNVAHGNTTLTSSSSTQHLRKALQALPYAPEEDSPTERKRLSKKDKSRERRGKVEHFVPAIWVPDAKADSCMRCGGVFGWRRRRHHCRLCGQCVCASCSAKTFFIADATKPGKKDSSKPARACNACYDAVFPVLDPAEEEEEEENYHAAVPHYSSIGTLTALPASRSMPSLLLLPQATTLDYSLPVPVKRSGGDRAGQERPKSGIDFMNVGVAKPRPTSGTRPPSLSRLSSYTTSTVTSAITPGGDGQLENASNVDLVGNTSTHENPSMGVSESVTMQAKRASFSTAAVAVSNVAVHTGPMPIPIQNGQSKRFSLVLGKSRIMGAGEVGSPSTSASSNTGLKRLSMDRGGAVGKLTELLSRQK